MANNFKGYFLRPPVHYQLLRTWQTTLRDTFCDTLYIVSCCQLVAGVVNRHSQQNVSDMSPSPDVNKVSDRFKLKNQL